MLYAECIDGYASCDQAVVWGLGSRIAEPEDELLVELQREVEQFTASAVLGGVLDAVEEDEGTTVHDSSAHLSEPIAGGPYFVSHWLGFGAASNEGCNQERATPARRATSGLSAARGTGSSTPLVTR